MKRIALWVAAWTLAGIVFALPQLGQGEPWLPQLTASLADWWAWGLLFPAILLLDRRLPAPAHLAAGAAAALIHVGLRAVLATLLGGASLPGLAVLWRQALQGSFLWGLVVYFLVVGLWSAWRATQRQREAELALTRMEHSLAEARLAALRAQLDPHFLFNALNMISSQVTADPRTARRMIEHLGDLLRLSLDSGGRQRVPLSEELAFLDHYLAIQRMRFGAKLAVAIDVAPDARNALVPSLILQPLVENAIRHGLAPRAAGGSVDIGIRLETGRVLITVADDGVGLPPRWSGPADHGVGLTVTRERLAALHGGDAETGFSLQPRPEGGVLARISLPLEFA